MFGLPVMRFLHTRDAEEFALLDAARHEAYKLLDELMTDLARKIVKEQADAHERGKNKKG